MKNKIKKINKKLLKLKDKKEKLISEIKSNCNHKLIYAITKIFEGYEYDLKPIRGIKTRICNKCTLEEESNFDSENVAVFDKLLEHKTTKIVHLHYLDFHNKLKIDEVRKQFEL